MSVGLLQFKTIFITIVSNKRYVFQSGIEEFMSRKTRPSDGYRRN